MAEETQVQSPPSVTLNDAKYLLEDLTDKCRLLINDFSRTVLEYRELRSSYNQNLTLTNTYVSGLKEEVEKVGLPEKNEESEASITIDEKSYDGSDLPDSVRSYVAELMKMNQNRSLIEFRLRQLDAARLTYISSIKSEIEESGAQPVD